MPCRTMLPSRFTILGCLTLIAACAPSPLYTSKDALAPGAVPHDGRGRPVLSAAEPATANGPATAAGAQRNDLIFFNDLTYSPDARPQ